MGGGGGGEVSQLNLDWPYAMTVVTDSIFVHRGNDLAELS